MIFFSLTFFRSSPMDGSIRRLSRTAASDTALAIVISRSFLRCGPRHESLEDAETSESGDDPCITVVVV